MLTSFSLFFICTVSKSVIYLQITKLKIESNPFAKGFRDSASSDYYDQSLEHPSMESMMQAHHYHQQQQQQQRILEANNNMNNSLMFEKARLMMLYRPDYLASYSAAMQAATAGMSMYSPALLAAVALRTPVATLSPPSVPPSHQRPLSPLVYTVIYNLYSVCVYPAVMSANIINMKYMLETWRILWSNLSSSSSIMENLAH